MEVVFGCPWAVSADFVRWLIQQLEQIPQTPQTPHIQQISTLYLDTTISTLSLDTTITFTGGIGNYVGNYSDHNIIHTGGFGNYVGNYSDRNIIHTGGIDNIHFTSFDNITSFNNVPLFVQREKIILKLPLESNYKNVDVTCADCDLLFAYDGPSRVDFRRFTFNDVNCPSPLIIGPNFVYSYISPNGIHPYELLFIDGPGKVYLTGISQEELIAAVYSLKQAEVQVECLEHDTVTFPNNWKVIWNNEPPKKHRITAIDKAGEYQWWVREFLYNYQTEKAINEIILRYMGCSL